MATTTALATVTVGAGGAASISFNSIPQTYSDLLLVTSVRSDGPYTNQSLLMSLNGSSASLTTLYAGGTGAIVYSGTQSVFWGGDLPGTSSTSGIFSNNSCYIPNYTDSAKTKGGSSQGVRENNAVNTTLTLNALTRSVVGPITSITLTVDTANFVQYSTATLYGIWNGPETLPSTPTIGTATATGETTATIGFTPTSATNVDASYTALSSPGSITATGTSSPITVSGLTGSTAYTFQVRANNPGGSSAYSAASNSITTSAGSSYESIATATVGSGGQSSITFSSIPSTYKHLQLRVFARSSDSSTNIELDARFNSDSSANYANHFIYSTGSGTPSSFAVTSQTYFQFQRISGASATSGIFGIVILDIIDYQNTNKSKTVRQLGGTDGTLVYASGLWTGTSAVNNIQLYPNTGIFTQYSQIALYGIKG